MTLQTINLGELANDGTGDDLRTAFEKVNFNFTNLEMAASDISGATNLGTTGATVFKEVVNRDLKFRRILGENGVTVTNTETAVIVSGTTIPPTIISGDSGSLLFAPGETININGSSNITVGIDNNTKTITVTGSLTEVTGDLNVNGFDIVNVENINGVNWEDTVASLFVDGVHDT
jgi:hypothetical protein